MGTSISVVGTIAVVALGQWSKDKQINMRFAVGSGIYAAIIALIGAGNQKLAEQLGLLVLVTAFLLYIQPIASALGFTKKADESLPRGRF